MRRFLCLGLGLLMAAGCGSASVGTTTAREAGSSASCAALTPAQQLAAARLVFVGVVLPGPTTSPAQMRVERYLKGSGPGVVTVKTAESRSGTVAEDGIEPRPGERWQIYTRSRAQPFDTSICAGSARVIRPAVPAPANGAAASGFSTAAAKIAYVERRFVLDMPPALAPIRSGRFNIVSARVAYRRLRAGGLKPHPTVPPLVIYEEKLRWPRRSCSSRRSFTSSAHPARAARAWPPASSRRRAR